MRGLTTRRLHHGQVSFQIDFDVVDHRLVVRTNGGQRGSFRLQDGLSVAAFDRQLHQLLDQLGVDVAIREDPYGMPMTTPFPADTTHATYDPDYARRFWQVLDWADTVLEEFSGWSCGKQSPVHLFWHGFDLAVTRFSGRRAPPRDGADPVTVEAYSHEVISFGFWAGDDTMREPAFYLIPLPSRPAWLISRCDRQPPPGGRSTAGRWRCSATTRSAPPTILGAPWPLVAMGLAVSRRRPRRAGRPAAWCPGRRGCGR